MCSHPLIKQFYHFYQLVSIFSLFFFLVINTYCSYSSTYKKTTRQNKISNISNKQKKERKIGRKKILIILHEKRCSNKRKITCQYNLPEISVLENTNKQWNGWALHYYALYIHLNHRHSHSTDTVQSMGLTCTGTGHLSHPTHVGI